ncbi:ATPase associated with various cellular activities AAA_5 [Thiorhodococcus drewsii AZ1]|uniref:ATPase associated with various cellular activities AAA_5 n=1 Tax=Thiorhodococcus drewsii AZ1 TaxID=765913 RepID=G2E223_9GAMM|nr:AAA family ATPase [Thiorhodococcus drewsii]EGV30972.1 ATPase associated with various cellular activities AAA_5 [Thiorhodococcus drewsii AZ1]
MNLLEIGDDPVVRLAATGDMPEAVHAFTPRQVSAVNAALAARRPLLVRGEPGIGKSQLARAAAKRLGRAFVVHTVDARTESRDLLWHFDAIARLAEAQLIGATAGLGLGACGPDAPADPAARCDLAERQARERLAVGRFLQPGVLWWAFDWSGALEQAQRVGIQPPDKPDAGDAALGSVVLIDEIDKAEADVPNGLLEALGAGCFQPQGWSKKVTAVGRAPLVVITTNEERALPDAFIRRCLVLHLRLPTDPKRLAELLVGRGRVHFGRKASARVLERAAELLIEDRDTARENHWLPLPGQAEYLDLVRAVVTSVSKAKEQEALLDKVAEFVLKKHPDAFKQIPEQDQD